MKQLSTTSVPAALPTRCPGRRPRVASRGCSLATPGHCSFSHHKQYMPCTVPFTHVAHAVMHVALRPRCTSDTCKPSPAISHSLSRRCKPSSYRKWHACPVFRAPAQGSRVRVYSGLLPYMPYRVVRLCPAAAGERQLRCRTGW